MIVELSQIVIVESSCNGREYSCVGRVQIGRVQIDLWWLSIVME